MCGAAPWKPKIDCLSSPTAKIVRVALAPRPRRRRNPRRSPAPPPTGRGSYPAPRRPGCARCGGRACRAPSAAASARDRRLRVLAIRSAKSSAPDAPLGRVIGLQDRVADDEQRLGRGEGAGDVRAAPPAPAAAPLRRRSSRRGRAGSSRRLRRNGCALRPSSSVLVLGQEEVEPRVGFSAGSSAARTASSSR